MAAELTPARIAELAREAQIAFCLDKYPSFEVALVRKVEAALATQGAEPDGWLYVMHMEGGQKNRAFSDDRYDFPTHSPFGRRGRDYSEEYEVTEHPIHLTAPPPAPTVNLQKAIDLIDRSLAKEAPHG